MYVPRTSRSRIFSQRALKGVLNGTEQAIERRLWRSDSVPARGIPALGIPARGIPDTDSIP